MLGMLENAAYVMLRRTEALQQVKGKEECRLEREKRAAHTRCWVSRAARTGRADPLCRHQPMAAGLRII